MRSRFPLFSVISGEKIVVCPQISVNSEAILDWRPDLDFCDQSLYLCEDLESHSLLKIISVAGLQLLWRCGPNNDFAVSDLDEFCYNFILEAGFRLA